MELDLVEKVSKFFDEMFIRCRIVAQTVDGIDDFVGLFDEIGEK